MNRESIEQHLANTRSASPEFHEVVQEFRRIVRTIAPDVSESVMYGGIMFAAPVPFCGVFAYAEHVSVEFTRGIDLDDYVGVLEGGGKLRRHIMW